MKCFIVFSLCLLATAVSSQEAVNKKDYSEAFTLAEAWLDAQKDYEQLPGLSAAVVQDQQIIWAYATGMSGVEENVKAEASTLYSICSISKLFTSVAVMKLYDEGKLRLDDRISDLLPSYSLAQKYPESGPVTVRSLLTHSSGLPREAGYPYWTGPDFYFPTREEINAELSQQETLYPASTYFQYSNLGLSLLGEIVEEVSGMPYDAYIQEHLLKPLGLSDTRTSLPAQLYGKELAIGYSAMTRENERERVNFFQAKGITPAAGFTSNVLDLCKFASWQFRLRDTSVAEILKPSTIRYMHQVHWTDPDWETTWGLGFRIYQGPDGSTWAGHEGSCPGYRSALEMNLKRKMAYSVMINASGTSPGKYIRGIYGIMNKTIPVGDESLSNTEKDLHEYTGYYSQMPWWGEVFLTGWQGNLVSLDLPSDQPAESMAFFRHIQGDTFRRIRDDGELGETLVFERDSQGNITRYQMHGNYYEKTGP